jgi:hypothetical protein
MGRALAQAVSRWFPAAAARVRDQVKSYGIRGAAKWQWGRFSPSTSVSPVDHSGRAVLGMNCLYSLEC